MSVFSRSALVAALYLTSAQAMAQQPRSHTYLEAGYVAQKIESGGSDPLLKLDDIDVDGAYAAGSVELGSRFFLSGGLHKGNGDIDLRFDGASLAKLDVDAQQVIVGIGYFQPINERLEWTAELAYQNTRLEFENDNLAFREKIDGDDYRLSLGLRGDLSENLEGWVKGSYTDGDVYEQEFSGTVGVLLKINPIWGLVAEGNAGAGNHRYTIGFRASF